MRKKTLIQLTLLCLFVVMALGSSSSSYPKSSSRGYSSSSSYGSSSSNSNKPATQNNSSFKKTDFPNPCKSCGGRKGYYLFDTWYPCKRCGGTGQEPVH